MKWARPLRRCRVSLANSSAWLCCAIARPCPKRSSPTPSGRRLRAAGRSSARRRRRRAAGCHAEGLAGGRATSATSGSVRLGRYRAAAYRQAAQARLGDSRADPGTLHHEHGVLSAGDCRRESAEVRGEWGQSRATSVLIAAILVIVVVAAIIFLGDQLNGMILAQ